MERTEISFEQAVRVGCGIDVHQSSDEGIERYWSEGLSLFSFIIFDNQIHLG